MRDGGPRHRAASDSAPIAAEIKVLSTLAPEQAYLELVPQFEKASGHTVTTTWAGTPDVHEAHGRRRGLRPVDHGQPGHRRLDQGGKIVPAAASISPSPASASPCAPARASPTSAPPRRSRTRCWRPRRSAIPPARAASISSACSSAWDRRAGQAQAPADADRRVRRLHRSPGRGRDRLPAGERAVARRRHRLRRPAAGRCAAEPVASRPARWPSNGLQSANVALADRLLDRIEAVGETRGTRSAGRRWKRVKVGDAEARWSRPVARCTEVHVGHRRGAVAVDR